MSIIVLKRDLQQLKGLLEIYSFSSKRKLQTSHAIDLGLHTPGPPQHLQETS